MIKVLSVWLGIMIGIAGVVGAEAAPSVKLGMVVADDVPVYAGEKAPEPGSNSLFKGMIVKILKTPKSKGPGRVEVESELGKGWVDATQIKSDFDRNAAKKTYETNLGMAWFFSRFSEGTYYETMSFENEQFSTDEFRSLIKAAQGTDENESNPAQIVLVRTLLDRLYKPQAQWTSRDRYFAKELHNKEFWLNSRSKLPLFWASMPADLKNNRDFLLKVTPNGAHLAYDLFSETMRGDAEIAKLAFKESPEALKSASASLKDNEDVVLVAALSNPLVTEFASDRLKDKEDLFKKIAPTNAMSLQFASDRLRKKPDFIIHVCSFRPWALQYAAVEVMDNESVFVALAKKNPMIVRLASNRLRNEPGFFKKMYLAAPDASKQALYDFAPAEIRHQIDSP